MRYRSLIGQQSYASPRNESPVARGNRCCSRSVPVKFTEESDRGERRKAFAARWQRGPGVEGVASRRHP